MELDLDRSPTEISRLLVLLVLVPVLLVDLAYGLPDGVFLGTGALVFTVAAGVHAYAEEYRATAGWIVFAAALALLAVVDVAAEPIYLVTFIVLLFAGLLLLASQRLRSSA